MRQFAEFAEGGDPAKQFGFHAQSKGKASCTGKIHIALGNTLCGTCHSNQHLFVKRGLNACIRREKEFEKDGAHNDLLHASPTLQDKKIVYLAKEKKKLQRIANQAKHKLDQMNSKKEGGVEIDPSALIADDLQTAAQSFFNENEISEDSLCAQIFQEMLRQANVAKKSGARCVRYSNITTRFAVALRIKMGVDKYTFLRTRFLEPCERTLSDNSSPGTSDPDGVLYSVLKSQQEKLEGHHRMKGKELGQKDFQWQMVLRSNARFGVGGVALYSRLRA
jgi:hypothetical protein